MASHDDIARVLSEVAAKHDMTCTRVGWEDCTRFPDSCVGPNIKDVRIKDRKRRPIQTLRSKNWNERVAVISAADLALVVGNHTESLEKEFKSITLKEYLENAGVYGGYAGVPEGTSLFSQDVDDVVSVRFQTVFLPVESSEVTEFTASVYSYGTKDALIWATSQGSSIQQSGDGEEMVYLHMRGQGRTRVCWLEATPTDIKVGEEQKESVEASQKAASQGKATASNCIGVKSMGGRMNTVMLIQVPLEQEEAKRGYGYGYGFYDFYDDEIVDDDTIEAFKVLDVDTGAEVIHASELRGVSSTRGVTRGCPVSELRGVSSTARVSMGTAEKDDWSGIKRKSWKRHPDQHITVTVTMYYTVEGGIPKPEDVEAAIADIDRLYKSMDVSGKLSKVGPLTGITAKPPTTGFTFKVPKGDPVFPK